jgi:NAD(P)-dependent dehydrogenase (short-subunit alcohol dehydrogenase family)
VDIVIANAGRFEAFRYPLTSSGITSPQCTVANETIVELQRQLETNTFGPLILYQTFASLLGSGAKFVVISSLAGKITDAIPFSLTAYGASKAAVNYITKKLDQESPDLIAFPVQYVWPCYMSSTQILTNLSPGVVDTDMTRAAFKEVGLTMEDQGAVTPAESVAGVLKVIDAATKESHGGKFWTNDGEELSF